MTWCGNILHMIWIFSAFSNKYTINTQCHEWRGDIHTYIHTCMHTCIHTHTNVHVWYTWIAVSGRHKCIYACIHAYIHVCIHMNSYMAEPWFWTYVHTYIHTCIYIYMCYKGLKNPATNMMIHTYIHTCIHTYMFMHTYVHVCIYVYMSCEVSTILNTCIDTYMHIYLHVLWRYQESAHEHDDSCRQWPYIHTYIHACISTYMSYEGIKNPPTNMMTAVGQWPPTGL
jgi:hypothetical protein